MWPKEVAEPPLEFPFILKKKPSKLKLKTTTFFQYIPQWFYKFLDVPNVVLINTRNGTLVL